MTSQVLRNAASRAGVTEEQAVALVRELSIFTHGMASAGDVGIPPFAWPADQETLLLEIFPGWDGLTRGEFNGTRAAVIWRAVCEYLLLEEEFYGWEAEPWEHPKPVEEPT